MIIVVKRPRAELDLLEIWDYIADDSFDRSNHIYLASKLWLNADNQDYFR